MNHKFVKAVNMKMENARRMADNFQYIKQAELPANFFIQIENRIEKEKDNYLHPKWMTAAAVFFVCILSLNLFQLNKSKLDNVKPNLVQALNLVTINQFYP